MLLNLDEEKYRSFILHKRNTRSSKKYIEQIGFKINPYDPYVANKVNSRNSTEAEFIALDNVISKVLWVKLFMEEQDQEICMNIIYRNNQSSMKMELNRKTKSGKRTKHFNINYFYITDLVASGLANIEYCPTSEMIGDFMTKPMVGTKLNKFREQILGHIPIFGQQECVRD
jgi:uncharacterized protein YegJ (DUF2314 family)